MRVQRFEIAFPDERWTQLPFLGWWDEDYELPPRVAGPWEEAGLRQTETARRWLKRTATGPPQTVQPPSTSISRRVSCAGLGAFIAFR